MCLKASKNIPFSSVHLCVRLGVKTGEPVFMRLRKLQAGPWRDWNLPATKFPELFGLFGYHNCLAVGNIMWHLGLVSAKSNLSMTTTDGLIWWNHVATGAFLLMNMSWVNQRFLSAENCIFKSQTKLVSCFLGKWCNPYIWLPNPIVSSSFGHGSIDTQTNPKKTDGQNLTLTMFVNPLSHRIGWDNFTGNPYISWYIYIYIYIYTKGFRLRFSLKPIHWIPRVPRHQDSFASNPPAACHGFQY